MANLRYQVFTGIVFRWHVLKREYSISVAGLLSEPPASRFVCRLLALAFMLCETERVSDFVGDHLLLHGPSVVMPRQVLRARIEWTPAGNTNRLQVQ